MKTIVCLFLFAAHTAFAIITSPMSNQYDGTGAVSRREAAYISVKNGSGVTVSDGWVMVWDTSADDGIKVTTTTTNGVEPACVVASNSGDIADGAMIPKCQIYGYHSAVKFGANLTQTNSATANEGIFTSNATGYAVGLGSPVLYNATEVFKVAGHQIGVALDTVTVSGYVESFINIK